MSMPQMFEAYKQAVQRIVKDTADQIPYEVSAFIGDYLQGPQAKTGLVKSKKTGNLYYKVPNRTNKLRTLYGNIQRSISIGGKGNISEVKIGGINKINIRFGYDTSTIVKSGTRSQSLEYAAINEATRPFLEPGFSEYISAKDGLPSLIADMVDEITAEFKRIFG